MAERIRLGDTNEIEEPDDSDDGGNYFVDQKSALNLVPSGCAVLDCVLGGGWPLGRIANIVGDESTGKTLLIIEAMANFHRLYPLGRMYYRESEAAFDQDYAQALGMPVDNIDFVDPENFATVEDFYNDLSRCSDQSIKSGQPSFYALDSLDALTSEDEQQRGFNEGSYETKKTKQLSKMFRMLVSRIAAAKMFVSVISQTRDNIGVTFGPKKTRSGGRALAFYASQTLWLSHLGQVEEVRDKVKRVVGIQVNARMVKSKIALPHRKCSFTIRFGHGIDSMASSLDWLKSVDRLDDVIDVSPQVYNRQLARLSDDEYWMEVRRVDQAVSKIWRQVESRFLEGIRRKY